MAYIQKLDVETRAYREYHFNNVNVMKWTQGSYLAAVSNVVTINFMYVLSFLSVGQFNIKFSVSMISDCNA